MCGWDATEEIEGLAARPASETVAAVDRTVSTRAERKRGLAAAFRARCRERLAMASATASAAAAAVTAAASAAHRHAAATGLPTVHAALGFVRVAALSELLLLLRGKHKRCPALDAGDLPIRVRHTVHRKEPLGE